jgi:hypothetical protein
MGTLVQRQLIIWFIWFVWFIGFVGFVFKAQSEFPQNIRKRPVKK